MSEISVSTQFLAVVAVCADTSVAFDALGEGVLVAGAELAFAEIFEDEEARIVSVLGTDSVMFACVSSPETPGSRTPDPLPQAEITSETTQAPNMAFLREPSYALLSGASLPEVKKAM